MVKGTTTIVNKTGLHARPASLFVKETMKYKSEITLVCNGPDEEDALKGMIAAVESGLGE